MTVVGFAPAGCESQAVAGCVVTARGRGAPERPAQLTPLTYSMTGALNETRDGEM